MVSLCQLSYFMESFLSSGLLSQILAYAQQSRESSNREQVSLIERMLEYKKQFDLESRESLNGSHISTNGDSMQPFAWRSHKEIEAVMQSAAKGKVFSVPFLLINHFMINLGFNIREVLI